jgi:signal transduction histidine kinase/CheY-like chemotaxis protein
MELAVNELRLGGQRKFVGTVHDITERKQAEAQREGLQAQLVQAQKMEAIGHLTGGIAHDFNNMLGAILGYAELLKQLNTTPAVSAKQGKYLDEILIAGNRAKELIAQMMAFSRRSPQSQDDAAPATALQPVVKEVVRLLRASIPSSIEVDYRLEDDTLKTRAQPVQLHQILLNLAINARDAIGEYGRIDITAGKRVVTGICDSCHASFRGEYVVLSVQDTGKGIPAHIRPRMFDPFFTTKDVGKGSGMGLAVVHGVVHAHGGHITVASGTGTTLRICLPQAADTEAGALPVPAIDVSGGDLSGVRVVVVDDESSMVAMLAELLEMHGARVAAYTQSAEALAAFEREPHSMDLVITDATMPELSGLDLASAMLSRRPALPIILCTGYSERVSPEIAKQHGIAGFMHKPVHTRQLVAAAARLARREP